MGVFPPVEWERSAEGVHLRRILCENPCEMGASSATAV